MDMELIKKYEDSLEIFYDYCRENAKHNDSHSFASNYKRLRFWEEQKSKYLYQLLGETLDISKEVVYNRPNRELEDDMWKFYNDNGRVFIMDVKRALYNALNMQSNWDTYWVKNLAPSEEVMFFETFITFSGDPDKMTAGTFTYISGASVGENHDKHITTVSVSINGTPVSITVGQKIMRVMGKVAAALNMNEAFEEFRRKHSLVFNQKKLKGQLHLSIHPMDYATASDNENGWSSCMSWRENGCYRLGTVEMMNSPMVICAYLASDKATMDINGREWPSKKWRAWVIVTPEIIIVNRHYPYDNDTIAIEVVNWVKTLAEKNLGWTYRDTCADLPFYEDQDDATHHDFIFETNFMYNDISTHHAGAFSVKPTSADTEYICFSGPANCMWCGDEIEYDSSDNAGTLSCPNCNSAGTCCCCGDTILHDDDIYWGSDNQPYCSCCFEEKFIYCDCCGEYHENDEMHKIAFPVNQKLIATKLYSMMKNGSKYAERIINNYIPFNYDINLITNPQQLVKYMPHCFSKYVCEDCMNSYDMSVNDLMEAPDDFRQQYIPRYDASYYLHDDYYGDLFINPNKWNNKTNIGELLGIMRPHYNEPQSEYCDMMNTVWQAYLNTLAENGIFRNF